MNSHQKEELWNKVAKIIREAVIASICPKDGSSSLAESNAYTEHERQFHVNYGPLPSKATVKTNTQFIMLEARSGAITLWMLDIVKEVLEDIERISLILHEGDRWGREREFLMFRGAWFDDKHGGVELFIDLLHDASLQPTLTEDDIRISFHDDSAWYGDQVIVVFPRIIKSNTGSDSFFATSNEHYIGFSWL
jgi:hypothetical protein